MTHTERTMSPARRTQSLVLIAFYSLLIYFGVISLSALDSIRLTSFVIWLLQIAPLLPFAWGLHKQHKRSYIWLSLVVLVYFVHGVLVAFDPTRQWQGNIQTGLCVILFAALMLYLKAARD